MRFGLSAALLLVASTLISATPAAAQRVVESVSELPPEGLRNGQFVWYEAPTLIRASTQPNRLSIVVSIPDQRAYVYRDKTLIAASTVSTGSDGHATPTGDFTILEKDRYHRSNLYSNAPMPFMQRLTWGGIALHGGHLPGYPASHGCIRLPHAFAQALFTMTAMGGKVTVVDEPIFAPIEDLFAPAKPVETAMTPVIARPVAKPAPLPSPLIAIADTRRLGGDAFNVVTMSGPAPAPRPASWVLGPAREIVQPIPAGRK
jgi:hypothetical protein